MQSCNHANHANNTEGEASPYNKRAHTEATLATLAWWATSRHMCWAMLAT